MPSLLFVMSVNEKTAAGVKMPMKQCDRKKKNNTATDFFVQIKQKLCFITCSLMSFIVVVRLIFVPV